MQLLDAILAFALTMAALATVVTVIMEACLRIARMRKKNFIEVMKLLNSELKDGALEMTDEERWEFFVRVVKNPAEAAVDRLVVDPSKLPQDFKDKYKTVEDRIASFGRAKAAGFKWYERIGEFLGQIFGDPYRTALYENVSLEYMLRCLVNIPTVKKTTKTARYALKVEFNRIARKYEELGSSVSASFKHHAQGWSIAIGIALAIVANIDGLRIFKAYRLDPSLAAAVIEKQDQFLKSHQEAQKTIEKFNAIEARLKNAMAGLARAKASKDISQIEALNKQVAAETAKLEEQASIKKIQEATQRAQQQVADLITAGVPIGWDFYPQCPFGKDKKAWAASSPKCKALPVEIRNFDGNWVFYRIAYTFFCDFWNALFWVFVVVISGVLIGLGAPFWFDIAKRLSQIRKGIQSAAASTEYRLSAANANGDSEKRKKIVDAVLEQAAAEAVGHKIGP